MREFTEVWGFLASLLLAAPSAFPTTVRALAQPSREGSGAAPGLEAGGTRAPVPRSLEGTRHGRQPLHLLAAIHPGAEAPGSQVVYLPAASAAQPLRDARVTHYSADGRRRYHGVTNAGPVGDASAAPHRSARCHQHFGAVAATICQGQLGGDAWLQVPALPAGGRPAPSPYLWPWKQAAGLLTRRSPSY